MLRASFILNVMEYSIYLANYAFSNSRPMQSEIYWKYSAPLILQR